MSKTVLFQTIKFSISTQSNSLWPIDRTLSGTTTLGQSELGSNINEGVLYISQSSSITAPSNCLVSYQDTHWGWGVGSYPSAEKQSVYSTAQANWATPGRIWNKVILRKGAMHRLKPMWGCHKKYFLVLSALFFWVPTNELSPAKQVLSLGMAPWCWTSQMKCSIPSSWGHRSLSHQVRMQQKAILRWGTMHRLKPMHSQTKKCLVPSAFLYGDAPGAKPWTQEPGAHANKCAVQQLVL